MHRGENEMPTDIQYKDDLRKEKIYNEELRELIVNGETEKAIEKIDKTLQRINESLQD